MITVPQPISFQWDKGNSGKNVRKHGIHDMECEEVFFDPEKKLFEDIFHSGIEERYILLGSTKEGKVLFVVFTIRNNLVRVISARKINKKEKKLYA